MNLLIDLTSLADNFTGIERYAASLTLEMLKNNDNKYILIFKNRIHPMFDNYRNNAGIEMIIIPGGKKVFFNQLKLPFEIYKHKADWYLFLAFPVPVLLFKRNMVSTIHDICCWDCHETMKGLSKWYFRLSHLVAIQKCKRIITISKFSENRIVDKLKFPNEKIWLIYCGVDNKFLNYIGEEKTDQKIREKYNLPNKYILSLSTLEPRKNLRLLVDAYAELITEGKIDIPLVLAGRKGWMTENLLENIDKDVAGRIKFTGFIEDSDLPCIYKLSELFVFPTLYEGFGIPPLEAMYMGTKVVASDSTAMPEILKDGVIYFENNNEKELKDKILMTLEMSKKDDEQLVKKARTVAFQYNWNKEANKLMRYLNEDSCR